MMLVDKDTLSPRARRGRLVSNRHKHNSRPREADCLSLVIATLNGRLAHHNAFGQHRFNPAEGLPRALFVLDESEADVVVAVVAEADAGTDGGFGFRQQQL